MIGIVVTTYNRHNYTKELLRSIDKANLDDCTIVFVDDFSQEKEAVLLLKKIARKYTVIRNKKNLGVALSLKVGFEYLISKDCTTLMNLDNDAVVKPDFITKILSLHQRFPNRIVSGFNTSSVNEKGLIRHQIISEKDNYIEKRAIGGINFCFNKTTYYKYVKTSLMRYFTKLHNWDMGCCNRMSKDRLYPVVLKPSVVQHIGIQSTFKNRLNPDTSIDYDTQDIHKPTCGDRRLHLRTNDSTQVHRSGK